MGDGENKDFLIQQIKKNNLDKNIFLLGEKKNVYPYFKNARAVISCSLWEDPGAVMVESAFCNIPVISSNCPNGPAEFLRYNKAGYLFQNNSIESFKDIFDQFLKEDKKSIAQKVFNAKKNSKKYTFFNHYKNIKEILDE